MKTLYIFIIICTATLLASSVYAEPPENRPPEAAAAIVVEDDDETVVVPASRGSSTGCDTAGAAIGVKAGGFSMSFPTYPCSIKRTYEAIDHTLETDPNGVRLHGFWTGNLPRFFLRTRLLTKGLFSAVFGLLGLG